MWKYYTPTYGNKKPGIKKFSISIDPKQQFLSRRNRDTENWEKTRTRLEGNWDQTGGKM